MPNSRHETVAVTYVPERMCANSCATTACSCGRENRARAPSVTPITPAPLRSLKAKAFMPSVATVTHSTRGAPLAMRISSTMLARRWW